MWTFRVISFSCQNPYHFNGICIRFSCDALNFVTVGIFVYLLSACVKLYISCRLNVILSVNQGF